MRGDAIAGLLVVLINVSGRMVIGIVQQGLTFAEAAHTYTLLTVGDGLVTRFRADRLNRRAQTSVLAQSEIHPRARLKTVASI